jgi:hypothetical protein
MLRAYATSNSRRIGRPAVDGDATGDAEAACCEADGPLVAGAEGTAVVGAAGGVGVGAVDGPCPAPEHAAASRPAAHTANSRGI